MVEPFDGAYRVAPPVTVEDVITEPLSTEELRRQVAEVLANYGLSVNEFLKADIDDLETDELRDLWLIIRGALTPSA